MILAVVGEKLSVIAIKLSPLTNWLHQLANYHYRTDCTTIN